MLFNPLASSEAPELGIFYLEKPELISNKERINHDTRLPRAAGMAFLIHESGILATASHVPLTCRVRPGERIPVFGVSDQVSIEVQAEVLSEGWLGPTTEEGIESALSPYFTNRFDERPEVFRQDVAFLRLVPESARWQVRSKMPVPESPAVDALVGNARYLPLGLITSRSRGDDLHCWVVVWEHKAPACHVASASLEGPEPGLFDALRFKSEDVGYGFSGSPVWHVQRRVVVGVHRRSVLALPGTRIACDSRALVRALPILRVLPDRRLLPLLERPYEDSTVGAPQRHPEFLNWHNPHCLVSQEISEMINIRMSQESSNPGGLPAMQHLLSLLSGDQRSQILLMGSPGSGKSTLLRRLATALAEGSLTGSPRPTIPVLISALELINANLDLRRVLNDQLSRVRPVDADPIDVLTCIEETDARLVLLVDALDEVAKYSCSRILGSILRNRRPGENANKMKPDLIYHILITSRHTDETRAPVGPDREGLHRFKLHPLGVTESRELAFALAGNPTGDKRAQLESGLTDLRLSTAGATPLQVWMAAVIFRNNGKLPKRPLDLVHEFLKIATNKSSALKQIQGRPGLRISERAEKIYIPNITAVLALLADIASGNRDKLLTESLLTEKLRTVCSETTAPAWLSDVKDLVAFVFEVLPPAVGVLSVMQGVDGEAYLDWVHASFRQYYSACHALARDNPTVESRIDLFHEWLKQSDHWPALTLVSEMERRAEEGDLRERDAVEAVLKYCLVAPASVHKPRLFALRALAVGIDACGRTRGKQVHALVRSYVLNYEEPGSCQSIYVNDDLPNPDAIVSRPDLRNDIFEALEERFAGRLRLVATGRTPRILEREERLIERASLWSEMEALGLRRPPTNSIPEMHDACLSGAYSPVAEPLNIGGLTRLVMQDRSGQLRAIDVPSMSFAESLVKASRNNSNIRSTARLVAIASSWLVEQAEDIAPPPEKPGWRSQH